MAERTMVPQVSSTPWFLFPISGPTIEPFKLQAGENMPAALTLGRLDTCDLKLPPNADGVSRFHARFRLDADSGQWRVTDLASRWGTFLNGVKLTANAEYPLGEGDLLRISPWTFAFSSNPRRRGVMTTDDSGVTMARSANAGSQTIREDMLALLLEAAAAIHDAPDETKLAECLIDAGIRASGLPNGAVLRPVDTSGRYEILGARLPGDSNNSGGFNFSRSLLTAAADGQIVELGPGADSISQSMVRMNINSALCVPLMLGPAPAAFLYLDSRSAVPVPMRPNAAALCAALGRFAGLALANLKRMDVERRQAAIEHDLQLAAAAQRWVLPRRETIVGPFTAIGVSRPGRYVGGDFFDVIDLGNDKVAIALGDVSGKGVEASVLMTATQGYLNAALHHDVDPGRAVTALNRFVSPRRPNTRFVTLWVAVLDWQARTISYVDAGHSYGAMIDAGGSMLQLDQGGGPPLGVVDDFEYPAETVDLPPTGRVVIVSDGIVEQPKGSNDPKERHEFQMEGVRVCLSHPNPDDVATVFDAVIAHAGSDHLADDATAVCVKW